MKKFLWLLILSMMSGSLMAQSFTHADTLRGSNGPGRSWWDITHYDLHVKFDINDSTISGYNIISFRPTSGIPEFFQIDLQAPLVIDSIFIDYGDQFFTVRKKGRISTMTQGRRQKLSFTRNGNAWFVQLNQPFKMNSQKILSKKQKGNGYLPSLTVFYHGKPRVAKMPPWDGGLVWKKDASGAPWVGVACQGLGASVWYPCKDYQGDEPDSAAMHFTAPDSLMIVSNGRLRDSMNNGDGTHTITWAVENPINNYDISPYIGRYVHFGEIFPGEEGPLTMDYWVLKENLEKAKKQFTDAPRMMKAFEYWFGPYPFYKDGYKLVDAAYLGMEHQSAVAYGNHYRMGYSGRDLSGSGWGMKWDFIIVHESGHEWFGNNITTKDIADMWVHEGFTNYSESLFTEYYYGKQAATEYVVGIRKNIRNDKPVTGKYGVNNEGSGDMYYKAANMIHTIRQVMNDDEKFRSILRGLNKEFRHQTVTAKQVEAYMSKTAQLDFSKIFEQYLTTTKIPTLEYKTSDGRLVYRWTNCVDGFSMPVRIYNDAGELIWIHPTDTYRSVGQGVSKIKVDENFYVKLEEGKKGS